MSSSTAIPGVEHRDPQYFGYYAMLQHQQNMLQDNVRTSTYRSAILLNAPKSFQSKTVMDVGAGSGILSYFAVQAGADKVYAVEASGMAKKMQKLVKAAGENGKNQFLKDKIEVINAKIEDPDLPIPKVDTIVSEPIGVLLFHERMLESYIYARDHYLKPGGALYPSHGGIYLAPFTDATLWSETMAKARFWDQPSFYGVDLSALYKDARDEMFGMPVVGHFDPRSLITTPTFLDRYDVNFSTITTKEMQDITIPFKWTANYTGLMHGVAGWFDLTFAPPPYDQPNPEAAGTTIEMSTGPAADRTHWQQVRFLFKEPLAVNATQVIEGWMRCIVNDMRSYTIYVEVTLDSTQLSDPAKMDKEQFLIANHPLRRRGVWELHEQTYNYSFNPGYMPEHQPEYSCLYQTEEQIDAATKNSSADTKSFDAMYSYDEFVN
ncbi:S-adenosyl-L-methionine-dependent methyltransferase [Radiomyces spectabilis]|uniref:S-adenosyl-L-methionine-dependent methyltransferase n=1 Tax=Radiomyces spectabilis TaxID=64574 RepID=UPI002220F15D|nr:S-adenosyl-L-methionine-dependent methyltransferase [Radiomyces spectabilis]KAI8375982.1 S-adenosyl-L-methionine-dependent methyltransferase [Radiomyces spectabilis]